VTPATAGCSGFTGGRVSGLAGVGSDEQQAGDGGCENFFHVILPGTMTAKI